LYPSLGAYCTHGVLCGAAGDTVTLVQLDLRRGVAPTTMPHPLGCTLIPGLLDQCYSECGLDCLGACVGEMRGGKVRYDEMRCVLPDYINAAGTLRECRGGCLTPCHRCCERTSRICHPVTTSRAFRTS
jgi:hypothetical protein